MAAPQKNDRPKLPGILAEIEVDTDSAKLEARLKRFARQVEALLAEYQVSEYVVARRQDGATLRLAIIPCAASPEIRTGEAALRDTSAAAVSDALERATRGAKPSKRDPAKGLAPKKSRGVALRKR